MGAPIRVLVVEDSEDDATLLMRELRRSGYEPIYVRVDTPDDMKSALHQDEWDIVVSDYYMPGFSGLDAFHVLRESGLDIPFIIVSGKIGEDTAVEAMRAGVQDYIMKDNLPRLIPAVQRELQEADIRRQRRIAEEELRKYREHLEDLVRDRTAELTREIAERKRVEEELRESEERYRTVSELITDFAYSYRVEPGFRLVREWLTGAFERITGLTPEEMESRSNWSALIHKEDIDTVQRPLKSLLSRQTEESFEYRIVAKSGEVRWLREYSHSLWSDEESRVVRMYGAVQDITDRKRAEESLRESEIRYRIFADNTYDWEFWLTQDGCFLYTSPSCKRITGHEAKEFME
ncbi:MAG: PAS domain-containing protein, partial [Candidatus Latescibacterota bacterium]